MGEDGSTAAETIQDVAKLSDLRDHDEGELVQVQAVVAAPVGLFYKNTFHIVDETAGAVVKLASDQKDTFQIGQSLKLTGRLDEYNKIPRITLTGDPDVLKNKTTPYTLKLKNSPGQSEVGRLVNLQGRVIKRSGKSFTVDSHPDPVLISVRASTGITNKAPSKSSLVNVTGIAFKSGERIVLAPRGTWDIAGPSLIKTGPSLLPEFLISGSVTAFYILACVSRWIVGSIRKLAKSRRPIIIG
jgi:hypothetical protein